MRKEYRPASAIIFTILTLVVSNAFADQRGNTTTGSSGKIVFELHYTQSRVQTAVWITDKAGNFIDTVFLTYKMAKQGLGNKNNPDLDSPLAGSRRSTVPVWAHWQGIDYGNGNFYPPKDQPMPDAVTGATPKAGPFVWVWQPVTPLPSGTYHYFIEVNKSRDKNNHHDYHWWYRGQPSVVWKGILIIGDTVAGSKASIIGHGSQDGSHGNIEKDISTLTTALKILENASVTFYPSGSEDKP